MKKCLPIKTYISNIDDIYGNSHHYNDAIMGTIASQITSLTIVYSIVYSDADQIKHQSSASLAFVRGIHRGPVNSPHKWPVTRKMFQFDDVIMWNYAHGSCFVVFRRGKHNEAETTFSYAFSWMKICKSRLRFHWSLFPMVQLTIFHHWFRWWLGAGQAISHYLNQW